MTETTAEKYNNLRLLKFGAEGCQPCRAMAKARTLERIAEAFPGLKVQSYDCENAEGEVPEGSTYEEASQLADKYDVQAFPTLILEAKGAGEIMRIEDAISFVDLRREIEDRIKAMELSNENPW